MEWLYPSLTLIAAILALIGNALPLLTWMKEQKGKKYKTMERTLSKTEKADSNIEQVPRTIIDISKYKGAQHAPPSNSK